MEKRKFLTPPGLELRPLGLPARSQSLYRMRCPDRAIERKKSGSRDSSVLSNLDRKEPFLVVTVSVHWMSKALSLWIKLLGLESNN
jgi:hypothetical protein